MACWIHPMSGKGGSGMFSPLARQRYWLLTTSSCSLPGAAELSEKVMTAKELFGQPTVWIMVHHSDTAILQSPSHSECLDYKLPLIPSVMRTERDHVNGIFQFFSNVFLKN